MSIHWKIVADLCTADKHFVKNDLDCKSYGITLMRFFANGKTMYFVLYCRGKLIYPFPEVDTYVVDLLYLCGSLAAVYRDMLCCHTVKRPRATVVLSN